MKLVRFTFICFLITGAQSYAQSGNSISRIHDSLLKVYNLALHDSTRCTILNAMIEAEPNDLIWPKYNEQLRELAEINLEKYTQKGILRSFFLKQLAAGINNQGYLANVHGDVNEALRCFNKGLELDEEAGDKAGVIASLNNIGVLFQMQGNIEKALNCYRKSLLMSNEINDQSGMAESHNNIGRILVEQGDIPGAMDHYHTSLQLHEKLKDKKGISVSLNNLGNVYQQQGDTTKALKYYKESLAVQEGLEEPEVTAGSLHNIGHIYFERGNLELAQEYLNKSYDISKKIGNKSGMAHCLNSLGMIYFKKGNVDKALEFWYKNLKLCEETNEKQSLALALNQIGTALFFKKQYQPATVYCEKSLKLAQELGFPEDIKTASGRLSKIYEKIGDWKKAYQMLSLYKQMNDSLNNERNHKAALQKAFEFEYEKKAVTDSLKTVEQTKLFEIEIKQEKIQRRFLYLGIGLMALFALFIYNRFRLSQKQKLLIELKEKETQIQKNIIEEKHKEINDSINYAERIQRSFLATDDILKKHLRDYFIFFKPKSVVSGDFYWAAELSNGRFAFAVADSTGHGVPGAIMSLLNITSLEKAIETHSEPEKILNETRSIIINRLKKDGSKEGGKDGMDGSLISIDFKNGLFTYAAANNPVWLVRNGELLEFIPDKMPVGKHDREKQSFNQHNVEFQSGDMLYLFTDGLPDQFGGPNGKKFKYKQLKELLIKVSEKPVHEQKDFLEVAYDQWRGQAEQVDDITVVGMRV